MIFCSISLKNLFRWKKNHQHAINYLEAVLELGVVAFAGVVTTTAVGVRCCRFEASCWGSCDLTATWAAAAAAELLFDDLRRTILDRWPPPLAVDSLLTNDSRGLLPAVAVATAVAAWTVWICWWWITCCCCCCGWWWWGSLIFRPLLSNTLPSGSNCSWMKTIMDDYKTIQVKLRFKI